MRTEKSFNDGWEFSLGEQPGDYQPVQIPHDWAISAPFSPAMRQGAAQAFRDRWGTGWYRKHFSLAEKQPERLYFLEFQGIYENSTVWVNGQFAGGRKYGYSTFQLDITGFLQKGKNEVLVKVDNTAFPADRWYSGAGIYRPVRWIETEREHLNRENIVITTGILEDGAGIVFVRPGRTVAVTAVISDGSTSFSSREAIDEDEIFFYIPDPRLWSPDEPNLYSLRVTLWDGQKELDALDFRVGIREIEFRPNAGMFLNGKPTKLKGLCVHQALGCLGTAFSADLWRERLLVMKEMGCNAVRAAHHIFAPTFLDLCDELGFLVYEEAFDKWTGGSYGRYFETEWKKDIDCMVKRDRNHPCICIWGTGNEVEFQGQESMLKILRMLKDEVFSLDPTRPVSYAMNPHFKREKKIDLSKVADIQKMVDETDDLEIDSIGERLERIKGIGEIVDIICCNYQEQWYEDIHRAMPDKLILGTETYQYFRGHSRQMQNFTMQNPWLDVEKHDYVIGGMIWTGIDYLGESMGWPAKGWSGALVTTNNLRRPVSYLLQSWWNPKPLVHFSVMDYSLLDEGVKGHWDVPRYADHWEFPQFLLSVVPYMISTNCEEVSLSVNGKVYQLPKPVEHTITGFLPYQPGTVEAVGYIGGEAVCSHRLKTPGPAVKLQFLQDSAKLPLDAKILLTVQAADMESNPVFRESARVLFTVEGPAELVAFDNGDICGNEPYQENRMHLYRGKTSVVVRRTGPGRVKVSAFSDGMMSGACVLV